MAYMSSPVILGAYFCILMQNGRMACLDLRTGEERWRSGEGFGDN